MLKYYIINGLEWQYEEGEQPAGAVELVKAKPPVKAITEPEKKAVTVQNKSRRVKNK